MTKYTSILKTSLSANLFAIVFILLASPTLMYGGTAQEQILKAAKSDKSSGAPVVFNGQVLFTVQSKILSLPPDARAKLISERIERLAKDPLRKIAAITTSEGEAATDIVNGDLTIMTVTNDDAKAAGKSRATLATEYAQFIKRAIESRREQYGIRTILFDVLYAAIATVVFILLLYGIGKAFPRIYLKISSWEGVYIRPVKLRNFEIVSAARLASTCIQAIKYTRLGIVIVLLYFYVPLVLSFFPWTAGYSSAIFGYIMTPLHTVGSAFLSYLPNLFFLFVIIILTRYGLKLVQLVFNAMEKEALVLPGFHTEWALPTYKIVRFLILAFSVVVAFPYLPGSGSPAFQGISVLLGVLFSFGSAGAISNIVAGVILTYMRAFKIGDRVKISDTIGDIIEKTLLVTRIRTIKNEDISVPNSMVLNAHIINYSASSKELGLILHTTVTIGYDAPWRKVHELLISAAFATEHILKEPKPFVLQTSLDDFYVSYQLNAYTDQPNKMAVIYAVLHQNIQDKFNEGGVEIMSPHYSSLRDGNQTTIPEGYLEKGYKAPGFRIDSPSRTGNSADEGNTTKR